MRDLLAAPTGPGLAKSDLRGQTEETAATNNRPRELKPSVNRNNLILQLAPNPWVTSESN